MIDQSIKFAILDSLVNRYSHNVVLKYDIGLGRIYVESNGESQEVSDQLSYNNIYAIASTSGTPAYPGDDDVHRSTTYDTKKSSVVYKTSILINKGFPDHLVVLDGEGDVIFSQNLVGSPLHNMFSNIKEYGGLDLSEESITFEVLFGNGSIDTISVLTSTTNAMDSIDDIFVNGLMQFNASHTNIFNIEIVIPLNIDHGVFYDKPMKVILCDAVNTKLNDQTKYYKNIDGALVLEKQPSTIMSNVNRSLIPYERIIGSSQSQYRLNVNKIMNDLSVGNSAYIMLNGQVLAYAILDDLPNYEQHEAGRSSYYYFHPGGEIDDVANSLIGALEHSQIVPFSYYKHGEDIYIESPTGGAISNHIKFIYANEISDRFTGANNGNNMKVVVDKKYFNQVNGRYTLHSGKFVSPFTLLDNIYDKEFGFDDEFDEFTSINDTFVMSFQLTPNVVNGNSVIVGDGIDQTPYTINSPHISIDRMTSGIDRSNYSMLLSMGNYIESLTEPIEFYIYDEDTGDLSGLVDTSIDPTDEGVVKVAKFIYDNSNIETFEGLRMYDTGYFNDGGIKNKLYEVEPVTDEAITLYTAYQSTGVHKDGYHMNTRAQIFSPNGSTPKRTGVSVNPAAYSHEWFDYCGMDAREESVIQTIDMAIINDDGEFIYRGWKGQIDPKYSGWGTCFVACPMYDGSICQSEVVEFENIKVVAHVIGIDEGVLPLMVSNDYFYWMNSIVSNTNSQTTIFGAEYTDSKFPLMGVSSTIYGVPLGECSVYGDRLIFGSQVRNIINLSTEIDDNAVMIGYNSDSLFITTLKDQNLSWTESESTINNIGSDGSIEVSSIGVIVMANSLVGSQVSASALYNQTNSFKDIKWVLISAFDNALGELSKILSFSNISTLFPEVGIKDPDVEISGSYKRHSWNYRVNPLYLNDIIYKYYTDTWEEENDTWDSLDRIWSTTSFEYRNINTEYGIPTTNVEVNPKTIFIHCEEYMVASNGNDRPYIEKEQLFSSIWHDRLVSTNYEIESVIFVTNDTDDTFIEYFGDAVGADGSKVHHANEEMIAGDTITLDTQSPVICALITLKLL